MFSPRTFAIFALLAAAAAGPATDRPAREPALGPEFDESFPWYFPFGGFAGLKNFFDPLLKWFPGFDEIGPNVQLDDDNLRVVMNVRSYKKDDLKVKVKGDFIIVQGSHEAKRDEHDLFASQFFNSYSLPANSSAEAVTATLTSDGYLVVDAPAVAQAGEPVGERVVPIVESGKPLETEQATTAAPEQASTAAPAQASTAADREEVTDSNNDIPHGTENELTP